MGKSLEKYIGRSLFLVMLQSKGVSGKNKQYTSQEIFSKSLENFKECGVFLQTIG